MSLLRAWILSLLFFPVFSDQFLKSSDFKNNAYVILYKTLSTFLTKGSTYLAVVNEKISSSKNSACIRDIRRYFEGIRNQEDWALRMMDASPISIARHGLTEGTSLFLGSSEICLNVTPPSYSTQFCNLNVYLPLKPFNFVRFDICLPSTCEEDSLNSLYRSWEDFAHSAGLLTLKSVIICQEKTIDQSMRDPVSIIVIFLCIFLIVLVIVATVFHLIWEKRSSHYPTKFNESQKKKHFLLCFSALRNGRKLFEMRPEKHFDCFDGIRVLSVAMVVMGHLFIILTLNADNTLRILEFQQDTSQFIFRLLYNFIYCVDSFFAMSGLLVSYIFLKLVSKRKRPSWMEFYFDRFIRLSPAHYFMIIIIEGLYIRHRSFQYHHAYEGLQGYCERYVWSNFLYINNLVKEPCIMYTWYLACDVQFYLVSPIILTAMVKRKSRAILIILTLILSSAVATFTVAYSNEFYIANTPDVIAFMKQMVNEVFYLYMQPYCRIGTYLIGMGCGWILFETKCQPLFTKKYQYLLWFLCFFCLYWSVWFTYHFETDLILSSICYFLLRYVWTIGLCILIYLCCTGAGGIINSILSWQGWTLFSRISYCTYLGHFIIIHYIGWLSLKDIHGTIGIAIFYFLMHIQYAFLGGLVLHLAVEAPANNLRELFKSKRH